MAMDPITAGIEAATKIIDKLFPDKAAAEQAKLELMRMQQAGELAYLTAETDLAKGQMAINQEEAKSQSVFVAGARPAALWVCVFGLANQCIVVPLISTLCALFHYDFVAPAFADGLMNGVLTGLLGLGGMRTYEYAKGIIKK